MTPCRTYGPGDCVCAMPAGHQGSHVCLGCGREFRYEHAMKGKALRQMAHSNAGRKPKERRVA